MMTKIYKEDVYNAFGDEPIWTNHEETFPVLYEQGWRYITHHDKNIDDIIYSIKPDGGYGFEWSTSYEKLPSKNKQSENKVMKLKAKEFYKVSEVCNAIKLGDRLAWQYNGKAIELKKDDILHEFLRTSIAGGAVIYNIYEIVED